LGNPRNPTFVIPDAAQRRSGTQCLCVSQSLRKLAASMRLAFQAIGFADVRAGFLPTQSGSVRDQAASGPE
jgi:hypothetical protein